MIIQIISLSANDVFKKYSDIYKIYRDVYQPGLLGLELRGIPSDLADNIQRVVLREREICYKNKDDKKKSFDLFIPGSLWNIKDISRKIVSFGDEDLGYRIINTIKNYEEYDSKSFVIARKQFDFSKSYVMGILNVTPDSFSDGGEYFIEEKAIEHGIKLLDDGADILDIGGESTRPGAEGIHADEELERIIPVITGILKSRPEALISVDTIKAVVAEEALSKGAKIINDISGLSFDTRLLDVIVKSGAALVIMHMKGTPKSMQNNPFYEDLIREIYDFLNDKVQTAQKAGAKNIIIDPGIGFGKSIDDNFEILRRLEDFKGLGHPLLIGVSRKSFIGKTLDLDVKNRDGASAMVEAVAIRNGARIIRTHNVANGVQVTKLLNHLRR